MALSPRILPFIWKFIFISKWKWMYNEMNLPTESHFHFKMKMTLYQNDFANGKSFSRMTFAKWVLNHFGWLQRSFWAQLKWECGPKWKCQNDNELISQWKWNESCRLGTPKWLLQNESGFILQNESENVEMNLFARKVIFILQNEIKMTLSPPPCNKDGMTWTKKR